MRNLKTATWIAGLLVVAGSSHLSAQQPEPTEVAPANPMKNGAATTAADRVDRSDLRRLETLINDLAREHIPHQYSKTKDWGQQAERWDGLHIQLKDFQLKTKRRKKLVNHGTWKKYSAELADAPQSLKFRLNSIEKDDRDRIAVRLSVIADLKLFGRIAEWVKGVQLFSISVQATATVQLDLHLTLATRLDFSHIPPDLHLDPVIQGADLTVTQFQIQRISKVGGEVAQQVGRGVRQVLDDKIEEYEAKLVSKMNASIAKKKDSLKLSVAELVDSEWSKFQDYLLPDDESR